jgi:hypothetical protein
MYLVALAALSGPAEAALGPLAAGLGTTLYELKLLVNAGFPAVVLATVDGAKASDAVRVVERLGHAAVSCARADVVPSGRMTALRAFTFEAEGLRPSASSGELLPYGDIGAMLRATQRTTTETTEEVKERKLRPAMAVATGGLVLSKKTTREVTTRTEQREQVLYLFRRSGAPPWILRERSAHYGGLGPDLRPASAENFLTTIRRLRERAPAAAYDERLLAGRPIRGVAEGAEATDILAHLLSAHLVR